MRVVFIIFFILLLLTVTIIFFISKGKNLTSHCDSDSDCPSGYECRPDPDENGTKKCFPKNQTPCDIDSPTSLVQCSLSATGYCENRCANSPPFACIEVSKDKPYKWSQNGKNINIPPSPANYGWCLPNVENTSVTCNPFTADYVLEENPDGSYSWGCLCKYPGLFDQAGPGQDCVIIGACGGHEIEPTGNLYVPRPYSDSFRSCTGYNNCDPQDKCLAPEPSPCGYTGGIAIDCTDPSNNCVCHTDWHNVQSEINPLLGQCVCESNYGFQCVVSSGDSYTMSCMPENQQCYGFDVDPNSGDCGSNCYTQPGSQNCVCCICPTGYIRCPDDCINSNTVNYCRNNGPMCIPDPCNTAISGPPNGKWDPVNKLCICASGTCPTPDQDNPVGFTCIDPCNSYNNPCGNRGDCIVTYYNDSCQAGCTNCIAPYSNTGTTTCTCDITVPSPPYVTCPYDDWNKCVSTPPPVGSNEWTCCEDSDCWSGNCSSPNCQGKAYQAGVCRGQMPVIWSGTCIPTPPQGPVICNPNTTAACPENNTCCQITSGAWNCCPAGTGATCCSDNLHCCASDHPYCDTQAQLCRVSAGSSDTVPWQTTNPQ